MDLGRRERKSVLLLRPFIHLQQEKEMEATLVLIELLSPPPQKSSRGMTAQRSNKLSGITDSAIYPLRRSHSSLNSVLSELESRKSNFQSHRVTDNKISSIHRVSILSFCFSLSGVL
jgi:hypothetical protein